MQTVSTSLAIALVAALCGPLFGVAIYIALMI
jgi:hypothetical protein